MIAVHGLDNTVEYVLRIVARHVDIEAVTGKSIETAELAALAGEVNRFLNERYKFALPYFPEIKLLRQMRNLVQHGISDPGAELDRLGTIVERFFNSTMERVFGLKKDDLRLSSIIVNDLVRNYLAQAEQCLDSKDWLGCIVASRDAFENARFEKIKDSSLRVDATPAISETSQRSRYLSRFFGRVRDELEMLRLGVDQSRYDRFRRYLDHIPLDRGPERMSAMVMQRDWEQADALFCYHFASGVVVQWERAAQEPLYELPSSSPYDIRESLGDVDLTGKLPGGCLYAGWDAELQLIYAERSLKNEIGKLTPGNKYLKKYSRWLNGHCEHESSREVVLMAVNVELVTNNPPRWEIILEYHEVVQ